jgi:predicted aspartyl protease
MKTHGHRCCSVALAALVVLQCFSVRAVHAQRRAPLARVPIDLIDGYVLLKVQVDRSDDLDFILDTGATRTVIDSATATELGLVATRRTRNDGQGPRVEQIAEDVGLTVGKLALAELDLLLSSSDRMELNLGVNIDGVIGADLLRDYVVDIDHDKKMLTIHDAERFVYAGGGSRLDIDANAFFSTIHGALVVGDGEVLGGRFLIDTGAGVSLALNTPFVNDNNLLVRLGATDLAYTLSAQEVEMTTHPGRVRRLELGDHGFDNMPVLLSQTEAGPLSPTAIAGIIGNRVWKRFNVVFDYSRDAVFLEPNESYDDDFRVDGSGLALAVNRKGEVIEVLLPLRRLY